MKVIGAGFPRTGTLSLKTALEQLGFGPCYHMKEVFENPAHAKVWLAAAKGEPVDWKKFFEGYEATVDFPSQAFYQELMDVFPDAKVILSVRDPERWYDSMREIVYRVRTALPWWTRIVMPFLARMEECVDRKLWHETFHDAFEDRTRTIEAFNRHNEAVRQFVPEDKLLEFDVRQGWEPLCTFLGVPVPASPFPHVNDRKSVRRIFKAVRIAAWAVPALVAGGLGGLYFLLRKRHPTPRANR